MPKKTRKRFTAQEKGTILRLHLLEHVPVSDLCDQHGIHPTLFYRWQKEFFENGSTALEHRSRSASNAKDRQIALLEQKIQRKHEVFSELIEKHIKLNDFVEHHAATHSWERRWAELLEQMPVAFGAFHRQQVRRTKEMASMVLRSSTRGR